MGRTQRACAGCWRVLMDTILVVEDTAPLREVLCSVLESEGFRAIGVASAEAALEALSIEEVTCVLADFKLGGMNGIELVRHVRTDRPQLPFLIMTAFGSIDIAVEAMKCGASDFLSKPFEPSFLVPILREVIQHNRIVNRTMTTKKRALQGVFTTAPAVEKILSHARQVARVDSPVLLLGESGTGKEVMARYIHEHSPRHDKPFIALNCGAIPSELLESEFFGHESGAFTGATQSRVGVLEMASDGTVFLDEVGEMPPLLQVKLLRALQEHEIRRVGGNRQIRVFPRIIAATNRSMEDAIASGAMREDFYFRIAVVTLQMPPLRERREDIRPMAERLLKHFGALLGKESISFDPLALDILESYAWPGNIRELENVVERAALLASGVVSPEDLGLRVQLDLHALEEATRTLPEITAAATRRAEIEAIERALSSTGGNKSRAAELLGVSYKTLLNKVREYRGEISSHHADSDDGADTPPSGD